MSDFPPAFASGLWPQALPDRPADGLRGQSAGTDGISRFSCMELSRMLRVSDSAGRMSRLALAPRILLPSLPPYEVGAPEGVITELNGWPACSPVNACDAPLRTRRHDSGPWRGATAFHVRLFHSLLHAGLSRRFLASLFSPLIWYLPLISADISMADSHDVQVTVLILGHGPIVTCLLNKRAAQARARLPPRLGPGLERTPR